MASDELEPMPQDWERALAIVAHPDDLEYGAAAAIAAWTQAGRQVSYLLVTRGEAGIDTMAPEQAATVREAEQRASAAIVGVHSVEFLDHADGVITEGPALRRDLAAAIRRHRPELLITLNHHDSWGGSSWNTPDHRAVGRATLDAAGDAGNRWIFSDLIDLGLTAWPGVRWIAVAGSPHPTHTVEVADTFELGVASLAEHRAYIAALSEKPPQEYAREFLHRTTGADGTPRVNFELIGR